MKEDFDQERLFWNTQAHGEEQYLARRSINRDLRWLEIERHLDGIGTILDVGGATGAFSIPLARRGFSVTHVDLAPMMIELARSKAQNLNNIRFVNANALDLSIFEDQSFDLVLNMDGPISSCGTRAEQAIFESARVTRKKLIMSVAHRGWMSAACVSSSIRSTGNIIKAVYVMMDKGSWHKDQFAENDSLATEFPFRAFRAFLPDELAQLLERSGLKVLRAGGVGSLETLCQNEVVEKILKDNYIYREFLTLCDHFDRDVLPQGPGSQNDTGLIAVAERPFFQ